jgi:hypothetical protein
MKNGIKAELAAHYVQSIHEYGPSGFVRIKGELYNQNGKVIKTLNTPNLDIYLGDTKTISHLERNEEEIDLIREELKRKNLDNEIKGVLNFVSKSLNLLKIIGKKVGVVVTTLTDVLAFTFLSVPVMNMLKDYAADKGFNIDRVEELMYGLGLSAVSYTLKNLMKRK